MGKKIVPVIITTVAALEKALAEEFTLLYVDAQLYGGHRRQCDALLEQFGCRCVKQGHKGVFFQRYVGEKEEDIGEGDIYDPLGIL